MANEEKSERDVLQELISKSESEFETKLTYISAGALLLSVTLLEKIIKLDCSIYLWIVIVSWVLLILTLLLNLISHLISKIFLRKSIDEIDENTEIGERNRNYRKRLICIESINWITSILLILGIASLVIFTSINSIKPCKSDEQEIPSKAIIINNN